MKVVKQVVRVGNTGGVLVPREWVHGQAEVKLLEKPLDIEGDILRLLKDHLPDVKGIYLVGSYARGEQTDRSDVDVLVVTGRTSRRIEKGKYEMILISEKQLEGQLRTNALPLLPMIKEAKPVLNAELLSKYRDTRLSQRNLKWYFETTSSALDVVKAVIALDQDCGDLVSDNTMYSLVLRLRGVFIVECLMQNKIWKTRALLKLIKRLSGSTEPYSAYLRSKDRAKVRRAIPVQTAQAFIEYIKQRLSVQKKWAEARS